MQDKAPRKAAKKGPQKKINPGVKSKRPAAKAVPASKKTKTIRKQAAAKPSTPTQSGPPKPDTSSEARVISSQPYRKQADETQHTQKPVKKPTGGTASSGGTTGAPVKKGTQKKQASANATQPETAPKKKASIGGVSLKSIRKFLGPGDWTEKPQRMTRTPEGPIMASVARPPKKKVVHEGNFETSNYSMQVVQGVLNGKSYEGENFVGINLREATLTEGNFANADFTDADLSQTALDNCNFAKAVMTRADLSGADLRGADLSGADLTGVDLSNADLRGANLEGAKLKDAIITNANLDGAIMDKTVRDELTRIKKAMQEIDLAKVDLRKVDLRYVDLRQVDLRGVDLTGIDLSGVNLVGVNLSGCKIDPSQIDGSFAFKPGPGRRVKITKGSTAGADYTTQQIILNEQAEEKQVAEELVKHHEQQDIQEQQFHTEQLQQAEENRQTQQQAQTRDQQAAQQKQEQEHEQQEGKRTLDINILKQMRAKNAEELAQPSQPQRDPNQPPPEWMFDKDIGQKEAVRPPKKLTEAEVAKQKNQFPDLYSKEAEKRFEEQDTLYKQLKEAKANAKEQIAKIQSEPQEGAGTQGTQADAEKQPASPQPQHQEHTQPPQDNTNDGPERTGIRNTGRGARTKKRAKIRT